MRRSPRFTKAPARSSGWSLRGRSWDCGRKSKVGQEGIMYTQLLTTALVSTAAFILGIGSLRLGRTLWRMDANEPQVRFLGTYSPILSWLRGHSVVYKRWRHITWAQVRVTALMVIEICAIVVWALWLGRSYLDLD